MLKNVNGHYVVMVTGLALTDVEEVARLKSVGFDTSDDARQILGSDDYNKNHRLEAGKQYHVVLVPSMNRGPDSLKAYAKEFGYVVPKAGIIPRIPETVSDEQRKDMGFLYIGCIHDPIECCDDGPHRLYSLHRDGCLRIDAAWAYPPGDTYLFNGAFAFLES